VAPSGRFSLPEILGSAAFTGFEGSLLAIALKSFLPTVADGIIVAVVVGLMAGLVFVLNRRLLEGKDLPIFAVISLLLVMFVSPLHKSLSSGIFGFSTLMAIALVAIVSALVAVAVTTFFRLIYQLFSLLFSR
jgi:serine/threonine-protein kinase